MPKITLKFLQATLAAGLLFGQQTALSAEGTIWQDEPWQFTARFYGWLPDAPTTVTVKGNDVANLPTDVDTILEALNMAFMGEFEAKKGRWVGFVSPIYFDGDTDEHFTGAITGQRRTLNVAETVWLVDYGVGYELGPWELGKGADTTKMTLRPFAGFRYFHDDLSMGVEPLSGELDNGLNLEKTLEFNTPFVGLKANFRLSDRWSFAVLGDYGVADADEVEETWEALGVVRYHFDWKDTASHALFGYRYLSIELADDDVELAVDVKGPFIGIGFDF